MRIEVLDGGELVAVVNSTNNIPAIESEFSATAEIIRGAGLPPSAEGLAENTLYFRIGSSPAQVIGQWLLVDGAWLPFALGSSSTPDNEAPSIPANLAATNITATSFTLTWDASTGTPDHYEVYAGATLLGSPTSPTLAITGRTAGTAYSMTVVAVDAAGNPSDASDPLVVTTAAMPAVPTGLGDSDITATSFTLTWSAAANATGYEVFRAGVSIGTPTGTSLSVTGLTAETAYSMTVRARNSAGDWSAQSTARVVTTVAASDVTAPEVTAFVIPTTSSSLTVAISTFTATDAVGVTGYLITESATEPALDNAGWSSTAQTQFVFSTEGAKTLYAWARDAAGNISTSATDGVTITLSDAVAPSVPAGLVFTPLTATTGTLSWAASTDNVAVTGYEVFVDGDSFGTTTGTSLEITGLTATTIYAFSVRARDAVPTWSEQSTPILARIAGTLTITHTGATFEGMLDIAQGGTVLWEYADSTTSTDPNNAKNFGSTATRVTTLTVTPSTAFLECNFGYDQSDNGQLQIPEYLHEQQNITAITGFTNFANLSVFCAARNTGITALDFSGLADLDTIECYESTGIASANLNGCVSARRVCFEHNSLTTLDVSDCVLIEDLRAARNQFTSITFSAVGTYLWHLCIHTNPALTTVIANYLAQWPAMRELWIDGTNQSGAIALTASIESAHISLNAYTSVNCSAAVALVDLRANNNSLRSPAVNSIIAQLVAHGLEDGYLDLRGNDGPTSTGTAGLATLVSRGWEVYAEAEVTPAITVTPAASVLTSSTMNTINITMVGQDMTPGTPGSPTITVSGDGSITSQVVTDPGAATITYNAPSTAATITVSAGGLSDTFAVTEAQAEPTLLWSDTFTVGEGPDNGDGALDPSWVANNNASGIREGGALVRTDTGGFATLYNMCGGALPAQYRAVFIVAGSFVERDLFRGVCAYAGGVSRGVFWPGTTRDGYSYNQGWYSSSVPLTVVAPPPASWANNGIDHKITIECVTGETRIYLDDTLVGTHTETEGDRTGSGVSIIGDGAAGSQNAGFLRIRSVAVYAID